MNYKKGFIDNNFNNNGNNYDIDVYFNNKYNMYVNKQLEAQPIVTEYQSKKPEIQSLIAQKYNFNKILNNGSLIDFNKFKRILKKMTPNEKIELMCLIWSAYFKDTIFSRKSNFMYFSNAHTLNKYRFIHFFEYLSSQIFEDDCISFLNIDKQELNDLSEYFSFEVLHELEQLAITKFESIKNSFKYYSTARLENFKYYHSITREDLEEDWQNPFRHPIFPVLAILNKHKVISILKINEYSLKWWYKALKKAGRKVSAGLKIISMPFKILLYILLFFMGPIGWILMWVIT